MIAESQELAKLARALGHPHRLSILRFLHEQEGCFCGKIVDILPLAQSTVSQHLKKLKEANWITGETDAPRVCYCVVRDTFDRFRNLLDRLLPANQSQKGADLQNQDSIRATVRERYGKLADQGCGCGPGCCGGPDAVDNVAVHIGYSPEDLAALPEGANLGLGCGNPLEHAQLSPGETVLDLGSGAGIDCLLAAKAVGSQGKVIGVDMTAQMIEKARANARQVEATNVEFRLGEIEHLPVADQSVDVVISNCVVNLSPEKPQVFTETFRVLKPGGRLVISDLVLRRKLSEGLRGSVEAYVGCIAGASLKEEYLQFIREAGFQQVEVLREQVYDVALETLDKALAEEAREAVISVKVRAVKPRS